MIPRTILELKPGHDVVMSIMSFAGGGTPTIAGGLASLPQGYGRVRD